MVAFDSFFVLHRHQEAAGNSAPFGHWLQVSVTGSRNLFKQNLCGHGVTNTRVQDLICSVLQTLEPHPDALNQWQQEAFVSPRVVQSYCFVGPIAPSARTGVTFNTRCIL